MKVHESGDGAAERRVVTAMITDSVVLGRIAPQWDTSSGLFRSEYANVLGHLAVGYFREYGKAPALHIGELFATWAETHYDKSTVELTERFLNVLNDEYDENASINSEFVIDQAATHFRKVQMQRLVELVRSDLETGNLDAAQGRISGFGRLDLGQGRVVDVLRDTEAMRAAFTEEPDEHFIYLPGAYGEFFGRTLNRSQFVVFFAPMKKKKTFFLIDIAWRAMLSRRRVAFFEIGDLTQPQIMGRFGMRACRRPRWPTPADKPIKWPIELRMPPADGQPAHVEWEEKHFDEPLGWRRAFRACESLIKNRLHSNEEYLKLVTTPARTTSVADIRRHMEDWERDGWYADCVAEGSLVLTDHGLIPIEKVPLDYKVWDGENWVSHLGPVCRGEKEVISYAGVTATPDHQFWTKDGWRSFITCARLGLPIATTGIGRQAVRLCDNHFSGYPRPQEAQQEWEMGLQEIRTSRMQGLWQSEVDFIGKSCKGHCDWLSRVLTTEAISDLALAQSLWNEGAVPEREAQVLSSIRPARHPLQFCLSDGRVSMDSRSFGDTRSAIAIGSDRQRRSLRAGEHSLVHCATKHGPHLQTADNAQDAQIQRVVSRNSLRGCHTNRVFGKNDARTSDREVEKHAPSLRKSRVWDLLNAGPLHRFTVQGLLAHNCIVIDYADLLAPLDRREEGRDRVNSSWIALNALRQDKHCLVLTATQTNAPSFNAAQIDVQHFSEDNRKMHHLTTAIGINESKAEKELGLIRLNMYLSREQDYNPYRFLHCAGCIPLANPVVKSIW